MDSIWPDTAVEENNLNHNISTLRRALGEHATLDRPGNRDIQLQLFYSYGSNPALFPQWQEYFRRHQPPTLIVWGKNDNIFPAAGAYPYKRDLEDVELHLLDTGHFALEEEGDAIAGLMRRFLERRLMPF
jgi:pimeloyl-ACP methyl ester carboxylesterase